MTGDEVRLPWETDDDDITESGFILPIEQPVITNEIVNHHDNSLEMWRAMETYHNMGLSMVWGRTEDEMVRGKLKKAKSPLVSTWSSEPEAKYTLTALADMMHKANPNVGIAPIIICGKGSGNLIVLDIDEKHMPGITARFYLAMQQTYPDLFEIIRRHRTPSTGRHLLWRTDEFIIMPSSNPGLAFAKDNPRAGIESRTHGGYVLAPPGAGYVVEHDVPIPTISVADHEKIFSLARLFNEKVVIKTAPKQKVYDSIYDENPFQHFNSSPAAEYVLRDNGWDFDYENSQFTHYTRPGKGGGVSASWHKDKRFYHFFTTSSDIDTAKWNGNRDPASARCTIQYGGDWKRFYRDLVAEGFGRHKSDYEKKVIEKNKQTGKALPPNFSEQAQKQLEVAVQEKNEKYPYGTFWEFNISTENYMIQRERLASFMSRLGLRLYKGQPCIIEGQIIRKLEEDKKVNGARDVFNLLKSWIREEEEEVYLKISHEFSKFWQSSGDFMVTTLPILDESCILKSNPNAVYKFFRNGILKITKERFDMRAFQSYPQNKVWADSIIDREFHYVDKEQQQKSMYVDFLGKALVSDPEYVQLCVGYLACDYKRSTESYFLILQEPRNAAKGGGSGKGYFCKAFMPWTSVLVTDAQALKRDVDQLIQNWNGQKLVHLSDMPQWVNLSSLKNMISDDSQRKLLYKDITNIASEDMPKFIASTQWGLDIKSDGGVGGRVRELAFSDYFGRNYNRIDDEYGGQCPDIWDNEEREGCRDWDGYFSYMTDAVIAYLKVRKLKVVVDKGLWLKGFDVRFSGGDSYMRDAIVDQIKSWASLDQVTVQMVSDWYDDVCRLNGVGNNRRLKLEKVHAMLREYGEGTGMYDYRHGESMGVKREYTKEGSQVRVVKIKLLLIDDGWDDVSDEKLPF